MMKYGIAVTALATGVLFAAQASAQTAALGTTPGGATNQIGTAIASVVSENSDLRLSTTVMGGASQYIPLVNAGELEFGVANLVETSFAINGNGFYEGRPSPNVQIAAILFPFTAGLMVRADSDIHSIEDLAGRAVPSDFGSNPLGDYVIDGYLATEGMTQDDVDPVPVTGFPQMWDQFAAGTLDTAIFAVGSGIASQLDAELGGVRYIPFADDGDETAMQEFLPGGFFITIEPAESLTGVTEPTRLIAYDYMLFASADAPAEVVHEAVATMYNNAQALRDTSPLWADFDPEGMYADIGLEWHPGALQFYQEVGLAE